jgi:hypothetical protein
LITIRASQVPNLASPQKSVEGGEGADIGILKDVLGIEVIAHNTARDPVEPPVLLFNE